MMGAELHGKCVESFRDMLPSVRRVGALANADDPFSKLFLEQVQLAGAIIKIDIAPVAMVRKSDNIDETFATMKMQGVDAVVVQGSLASKTTADLALRHRLPAGSSPPFLCRI